MYVPDPVTTCGATILPLVPFTWLYQFGGTFPAVLYAVTAVVVSNPSEYTEVYASVEASAVVIVISCSLKPLMLLPSNATNLGALLSVCTFVFVRFIVVVLVPGVFVHTPVEVLAVHPPSIITLLFRLTVSLILYVPPAIRITMGLVAVPPVAFLNAFESVCTGAVLLPSFPSLPEGEQ